MTADHDFTSRELDIIFALCSTLSPNKEIAQQLGITVDEVMHNVMSIYDKAGLSSRGELLLFATTALNGELRRRRTGN